MDSSAKTSLEAVEDDRTGLSVPALRRACADNLYYVQGKFPAIATKNDFYMALAYTVRDRQLHRWINAYRVGMTISIGWRNQPGTRQPGVKRRWRFPVVHQL